MLELLTRRYAAEYLETKGVRSSQSTLARYAMGGDGPQYVLIGRTAYYKTEWLDQWLEAQMVPHSHSLAHAMAKMGRGNNV
ncbi:DNA-binding protein [Alphaproteobacteria bacterium]|nr:DNA-binding protein [Alphaproteobacteria bacterium]